LADPLVAWEIGEVLEYKIEDSEASYVVRVVSGTRRDQVLRCSADSLTAYSEAMCQVTLVSI